jgi:hypothetical protein
MSVTELQATISRLSPPQKRAVARYIKRLTEQDSAERAAKVGALLRKTDTGPRMTLAQIKAQRVRPART